MDQRRVVRVAVESRDRRQGDRRSDYHIALPERRTGFDRRTHHNRLVARYDRWLLSVRDKPTTLLLILAVFNALNFADLILTYRALLGGAVEANPFMERLFRLHPVWAGVAKSSVCMVVSELIWLFRRHRAALALSIYATLGMTVLLGYHLIVR